MSWLRPGKRCFPLIDAPSYRLCALDDIEDGQSGGYVIETPDKKIALMAIRRGDRVFTYINSCPHIGTPLDFQPGQFLDLARNYILCSSHGALFRINDGHCISGPCVGKNLQELENIIQDGVLYVRPKGDA